MFEDWVRHDVGGGYVQMFEVALANWVGDQPHLCVHSETCGRALAMEHTGDLYSCDHFVEPRHKLGNIMERLDGASSSSRRSSESSARTSETRFPAMCRECDVRFACHGGCPKDRFISTPGGEEGAELPVRGVQGASSTTPAGRCGSWAASWPGTARRRSSCSSTRPRMRGATATARAHAGAAASGSSATALPRSRAAGREPRRSGRRAPLRAGQRRTAGRSARESGRTQLRRPEQRRKEHASRKAPP